MKKYIEPSAKLIKFDTEDIMETSSASPDVITGATASFADTDWSSNLDTFGWGN